MGLWTETTLPLVGRAWLLPLATGAVGRLEEMQGKLLHIQEGVH